MPSRLRESNPRPIHYVEDCFSWYARVCFSHSLTCNYGAVKQQSICAPVVS